MRILRWVPAALVCLGAVTTSSTAFAQHRRPAAAEPPAETEEHKQAAEHFQRARDLYQAGKYTEAAAELEVARTLDPKAKELVMNLGIVNEKLGSFDDALAHFRAFLEMDGVTPQERAKVEGMIKRIEGAKEAAEQASKAQSASVEPPPPPPPLPPVRGRIDGLTITAGTLAVLGLGSGAVLGAYALTSRPADGFVTGKDGSFTNLADSTDSAHTAAIYADISFGVGIAATVATALLYFGRMKPAPEATPTKETSRASIRALPSFSASSATLSVSGWF